MMVAVAFAILVLAAAVVVLYAMMGELASRIPDPDSSTDTVSELAGFVPGARPSYWPSSLSALAPHGTLLVLSPICSTCNDVAADLTARDVAGLNRPLGVVVSCRDQRSGEEFIEKYALGRIPHLVDAEGAWVSGNFGVVTSPSALVIDEGVATEAYAFRRVEALLRKLTKVPEGVA